MGTTTSLQSLQECCNVNHYWIEGEGSYNQCMGFSPTSNPTNLVSLICIFDIFLKRRYQSHPIFFSYPQPSTSAQPSITSYPSTSSKPSISSRPSTKPSIRSSTSRPSPLPLKCLVQVQCLVYPLAHSPVYQQSPAKIQATLQVLAVSPHILPLSLRSLHCHQPIHQRSQACPQVISHLCQQNHLMIPVYRLQINHLIRRAMQ